MIVMIPTKEDWNHEDLAEVENVVPETSITRSGMMDLTAMETG